MNPAASRFATSGLQHKSVLGFTLLELLVVIVIIGLLAGYVAPRYFSQVGKSEVQVARAQLDALEKALDQYRLSRGFDLVRVELVPGRGDLVAGIVRNRTTGDEAYLAVRIEPQAPHRIVRAVANAATPMRDAPEIGRNGAGPALAFCLVKSMAGALRRRR